MRGLPQERRGGTVPRLVYGVRLLPLKGLSEDYESQSRQRAIRDYLRIVPLVVR